MKIRICCKCGEDYSVSLATLEKTKDLFCPNCQLSLAPEALQPLKQLASALLALKALQGLKIPNQSSIRLILLDTSQPLDALLDALFGSFSTGATHIQAIRLY